MPLRTIVVAGATGALGHRIVAALRAREARVVALTRSSSAPEKLAALRAAGAEIAVIDSSRVDEVATACEGASCVVSALLGVRDTMVNAQSVLLDGAVKAGVTRFIPSDYSLDLTKLERGENRNLDWHLEFLERLYKAPIAATSILNGAFMELLSGRAPFLVYPIRRAVYWGSADQPLDFTTMNDTAEFTAAAALDASTPKLLRIAGDRATPRQLAAIATEVTGKSFKPMWAGTLGSLKAMIAVMRALMPAKNDPFPPWQGMQYSHNMFKGHVLLEPLDNQRYPGIRFTKIREMLAEMKG